MRQIVLDTETTGLEPSQGHRIIEIGCVEMVHRRKTGRTFHCYLQPDREIEAGAVEVHGITNEFLQDKPRFADIAEEFVAFIREGELIIHNAPFDVGFIDHELHLMANEAGRVADLCSVIDTLVLARGMHPGQRNSLDALCKRYEVDNSRRDYHGALLDAEILCDVYLAMTGGQGDLSLDAGESRGADGSVTRGRRPVSRSGPLPVIRATDEELVLHEQWLDRLDKAVDGPCVWRQAPEATQ